MACTDGAVSDEPPSVGRRHHDRGVFQSRGQETTGLGRDRAQHATEDVGADSPGHMRGDSRDCYRDVEEWKVSSNLALPARTAGVGNVANSASTDSLFYLDGQMESR